jgi:uncharacterized protein with HEPN domain
VLEAIAESGTHERGALDSDRRLQVFLIHDLGMVGEAMSQLSAELKDAHPEVAWSDYVLLRNRLIHRYWRVDHDLLWSVVRDDLPALLGDLKNIATALEGQ